MDVYIRMSAAHCVDVFDANKDENFASKHSRGMSLQNRVGRGRTLHREAATTISCVAFVLQFFPLPCETGCYEYCAWACSLYSKFRRY